MQTGTYDVLRLPQCYKRLQAQFRNYDIIFQPNKQTKSKQRSKHIDIDFL